MSGFVRPFLGSLNALLATKFWEVPALTGRNFPMIIYGHKPLWGSGFFLDWNVLGNGVDMLFLMGAILQLHPSELRAVTAMANPPFHSHPVAAAPRGNTCRESWPILHSCRASRCFFLTGSALC